MAFMPQADAGVKARVEAGFQLQDARLVQRREKLRQRFHRQSDDVRVAAPDRLDEARADPLRTVSSGFVHRLAGAHVIPDRYWRQRTDAHFGPHDSREYHGFLVTARQ